MTDDEFREQLEEIVKRVYDEGPVAGIAAVYIRGDGGMGWVAVDDSPTTSIGLAWNCTQVSKMLEQQVKNDDRRDGEAELRGVGFQ